jgi:CRISPR-associated exonuclease Cas4
MSEDDDLIPISALQHLLFCERQAALIHVERAWADNQLTALGNVVHARADQRGRDQRRGSRVERAVHVRSVRLGISGVCDAVEWRRGVRPVETKRGPVVERLADQVQLCAQALCLEEMLEVEVATGVLFYASSHQRLEVAITSELRRTTEAAVARMRSIIEHAELPSPVFDGRCRRCSLRELCQPRVLGRSSATFLREVFEPER